ncbi:MAG: imidazole glycerol phosphate synthase subunit HisH [Cytophagaceae bacterium]|nr:imidazole glycerol phosphate synthase subunit HisH [Cytophagaceae bacterium]MDW8457227.1 imidazole glycerol phosphate synthase subunit HisH [Cytophagaceae bacterium]
MSKVVIIKYNAGNVQSVIYALNRLGIEPLLTDIPEEIQRADKVIFPGVGEAGTAMQYLAERKLDKLIRELTQPFLGICLGLQLMCEHSEEGNTTCLGVFPLKVKKFPDQNKVPQIGWNTLYDLRSPIFKNVAEYSHVYFVHSYYAECMDEFTISKTTYSLEYSSSIKKNNFYAVQFHPEKSSDVGSRIIENFLKYT